MEINNTNISEINTGLHTDTSPQNQPKGTYRFGLNTVNETDRGDEFFRSNEESNELCINFPAGFIPIGKCYIGNNETVIFLVKQDNSISEIGILKNNCTYEQHVNDNSSGVEDKLNFTVEHQIQCTYRLRRGCERTIYFTDDYNKPRYYNFDKPEDFKNPNDSWAGKTFNLFKEYNKIPEFEEVIVNDSGGQLKVGSYNIAIQYLDEELNPTEWITTSPVITIYNSSIEDTYRDIRGSLPPNSELSYIDFPETSKSIYVKLKDTSLDKSFIFYRLAFIEATTGTGLVTAVKYTDVIPTSKNYFIYTGTNVVEKNIEESLVFSSEKIERAQSIEQIENRLILANTEGKDVNFCNLQKYASRISADCITKTVDLSRVYAASTDNIDSNPKNPTAQFEGFGYMPGEIYSFGIVYVFEDGYTSPVYHIPGKNHTTNHLVLDTDTTDNIYPMSIDNTSQSTYKDNENCQSNTWGYWGLDSEGDILVNQPVRHHRFPMRKDIGLDLIRTLGTDNTSTIETVSLQINLVLDILLPLSGDTTTTPIIPPVIKNPFVIKVIYKVNGTDTGEIVIPINPTNYQNNIDTNLPINLYGTSTPYDVGTTFEIEKILILVPQEIINAELLLTTPNLINSQYLEFDYYLSTYNDYSTIDSTNFYFNPLNQPIIPTTPITTFPTGLGTSFINMQNSVATPGIKIDTYVQTLDSKQFESDLLGIRFTNIDLPSLAETNGNRIIGYYIVRNERSDSEKTIIDSAVLVPTLRNNKYISTGLLSPDFSAGNATQEKTTWGVIHPEHKFRDNKIFNFDEIIQEGNFDKDKILYGKITQNDISNGTSFTDKMKDGNDDGSDGYGNEAKHGVTDGFCIDIISRDFITDYRTIDNGFTINKNQVEKQFYLDALESKTLEYATGNEYLGRRFWDVYNLAADNKVGVLKLENSETTLHNTIGQNNLPYVIYKRNLIDNYSTFRQSTYYKVHTNIELFNGSSSNISVFGGDTMIHPMRYVNTVFWDTRVAKRAGKTNAWNIVLTTVLFITAVVIAIFSWGTGVAASAALIGTGAALIAAGGAALFASAAIKEVAYRKAYSEEYAKGLRETALDKWVRYFYQYPDYQFNEDLSYGIPSYTSDWNNGTDGPSDDTVQWIGDCITDLWFETSVNVSLRNGFTSNLSTHLNAPGFIESGNHNQMICYEYFRKKGGAMWVMSYTRYPVSKLEQHLHKKLLMNNNSRYEGYEYIGLPTGEYYNVNPDYDRFDKEKPYYHLPLEYDCCSKCQENFPHRVHYSEQSFQEELTDNYRNFLINNYRDIEGETGEITNVFKLGNNLFIHTKEGLWQMPRSYQERVTDQVISFIGTGSYFEIPPQKVLDDDTGSSAGTQHKWSSIKTPNGYFFVCENQRKIYQFTGKELKPISSIGLSNWFKENIEVNVDKQYYNSTTNLYPYRDNPSNPFGSGFISTYDTKKERVLFTKKDYTLSNNVTDNTDFEICVKDGQLTIFENINQTIQDEEADGWTYLGIEDCKLKFSKDVIKTRDEIREVTTTIANDSDIIIQFDSSGSFGAAGVANVKKNVLAWFTQFKIDNPDFTGRLVYLLATEGCAGQAWLKVLKWLENNHNLYFVDNTVDPLVGVETAVGDFTDLSKNIIVISTVNEAADGTGANPGDPGAQSCGIDGVYHQNSIHNPTTAPTATYTSDFNDFVTRYDTLTSGTDPYSFHFLQYPVVYSNSVQAATKGMLQSSISAITGRTLTAAELLVLSNNPNSFVPTADYNTLLLALAGPNPYPPGLSDYFDTVTNTTKSRHWQYRHDRGWNGTGEIITATQIANDINSFLGDLTTTEQITVNIDYIDTEYEYIQGTIIEEPTELNNSWTMSFSLKQDSWTSWHSYLPNFYINVPEKFYSWIYGNNGLWKHNKEGHYQTFYDKLNPFVLEYVSLSNPLSTRLWEYLLLLVEVKKYNNSFKEFTNINDTFFNKLIAYNSRQCSGLMNIKVKDADEFSEDYLYEQITNLDNNEIIVDRNERNWTLNNLRDIRTNYNEPIFISNLASLQNEYFIDKVLNNNSIDYEKDWSELESFRDKYLVVRLIFDNFAKEKIKEAGDTKLIMNFSVENETQSFR